MQKVRIISLEKDKQRVIAALHIMGAIDLRKSSLALQDDRPTGSAVELSDALIKTTGALAMLEKHEVKQERHRSADNLVEEVSHFKDIDRIYALGDERKELSDDIKALDYASYVATALSDIRIDLSLLKSGYVSYRAFETDSKSAKLFQRAAKAAAFSAELHVFRLSRKKQIVLIAYDKNSSIDELYKGLKMNELDLGAKYLEGLPKNILKSADERKKRDNERIAEIGKEMKQLSVKDYSKLANLREMLGIEAQRADVASEFKRTESTFIIEGWVRKVNVERLKERLYSVTDKRCVLEEIGAGEELAPTNTRRPGFLRPFDYLVSFYSVPRSDEIDPTWIFIFSFPIFYGLMVTDVGYGIASLLLATWITTRTDPEGLMYNTAKVWQLNSVAAIAFGLLSNQWFGFQLNSYVGIAQGAFDWLKNTPALVAITVIFGIVQVIIGLAIGIINSYNHGHKKIAAAKFTSILVIVFGTIAVAGAFFSAFTGAIVPVSGAVAVISLLATGVLSGSEATEITNLITHPLSYARLMGFGLGSVIIAFLIDMAFTPHLGTGAIGIMLFVVYAVIFIALHFLNMVLAIFEGIVQGVRLNFVEFFSKFYIGNGIPFRPFGYKRIHTKE